MDWISDPTAWSALAALLTLEIVLGVDNVVFISILASKLPPEEQDKARKVGLLAAGGMRVLLLLAVGWVITLENDLFAIGTIGFSGKELILLAGGLFLIYKATKEIHHKLEGDEGETSGKVAPTIAAVIGQVMLLDLVFSIDSVITAVGMTTYVWVMVIAIVSAVVVMLAASKCDLHLRQRAPVGEDVGAGFPVAHRHHPHRRGLRSENPQGVHLRGHDLFGVRRGPQHRCAPQEESGRAVAPA